MYSFTYINYICIFLYNTYLHINICTCVYIIYKTYIYDFKVVKFQISANGMTVQL